MSRKRTTMLVAEPLHAKLDELSKLLGVPKASIHQMALATFYVLMSPHLGDRKKRRLLLEDCDRVFRTLYTQAEKAA